MPLAESASDPVLTTPRVATGPALWLGPVPYAHPILHLLVDAAPVEAFLAPGAVLQTYAYVDDELRATRMTAQHPGRFASVPETDPSHLPNVGAT